MLIINLLIISIFTHNIHAVPADSQEGNKGLNETAEHAVKAVHGALDFFNKRLKVVSSVFVGNTDPASQPASIKNRFGIAILRDIGRSALGPLWLSSENYYNREFIGNKRPWWWTTFLWDAPEIKTKEEIETELIAKKLEETQNAQHIIYYKHTPLTPAFNIDTPVAKFKNVALTHYDIATTGVTAVKASSKLLLFKSVLSNRNDFLINHILQNSRSLENILKEYKAVSSDKKISDQIFKKMISEERYFCYILPTSILRSCALDIFTNYMCDSYCEKVNINLLSSNEDIPAIEGVDSSKVQKITNFGSVFNKFTSFTTYLLYFIKKNEHLNALILDGNQACITAKQGVRHELENAKRNNAPIAIVAQPVVDTIRSYPAPKLFAAIPSMLSNFLPLNLIKQKVGHSNTIDFAINLIDIYLKYLFLCKMIDSFAALNWKEYVFGKSDIFLDLVIKYNLALDSQNEDDIEICQNLISVFVVDGNKLNFTFKKFYNFAKSFIFENKSQLVKQAKIQFLFLSIAALLHGKQTLGILKSIGSYFVSKKGINNFLNRISLD